MNETAFPIVYTDHVRRLVRFYRDQFRFEATYHWPSAEHAVFVSMKRGAFSIGFSSRDAAARTMDVDLDHPTTPSFELCIYVDDVDEVSEALDSRGVRQLQAPTDRPWGERSAYFEDPDGNPIQLVTTIEDPSAADTER